MTTVRADQLGFRSINGEALKVGAHVGGPFGAAALVAEVAEAKKSRCVKVAALEPRPALKPVGHRHAAMPFADHAKRREHVQERTARLKHPANFGQRQLKIGNVLEYLVGADHIETCVGEGKPASDDRVDPRAGFSRHPVFGDIGATGIEAGGSKGGNQRAIAAAEVENSPTGRHQCSGLLGDEAVHQMRHPPHNITPGFQGEAA